MTFDQKQQIRKARRERHQKATHKLMHILGEKSAAWDIHKYSIERRVRKLGRVNIKSVKVAI